MLMTLLLMGLVMVAVVRRQRATLKQPLRQAKECQACLRGWLIASPSRTRSSSTRWMAKWEVGGVMLAELPLADWRQDCGGQSCRSPAERLGTLSDALVAAIAVLVLALLAMMDGMVVAILWAQPSGTQCLSEASPRQRPALAPLLRRTEEERALAIALAAGAGVGCVSDLPVHELQRAGGRARAGCRLVSPAMTSGEWKRSSLQAEPAFRRL